MPKILITGNDFDLNFGLPTSYNDFIKILDHISRSEKWDFQAVYENCDSYERIREDYKSFELENDQISLLKEKLEDNVWFKFFQKEFAIDSWIDFENRIEYVLDLLYRSFETFKPLISKSNTDGGIIPWNPDVFERNFEKVHILKFFGIFQMEAYGQVKIKKDYLISRYGVTDMHLGKVLEFLHQELVEFKGIFNLYFETFVFPFYDNMKARINGEEFADIKYHYTFNYTPTFDVISRPVNPTRFLHGKIDSSQNEIVLGINEVPTEKIDKKYFLPFTKYFQKLNNGTDYHFLKELEGKKNQNFMFFIYGHSLDKSDEEYIHELFDFIKSVKASIRRIFVIYHSDNSKSQLLMNLLNIRGKKDIQELMRNDILIFRRADSAELREDLQQKMVGTRVRASII